MTRPAKRPTQHAGIELRSASLEVDALPPGQRGGGKEEGRKEGKKERKKKTLREGEIEKKYRLPVETMYDVCPKHVHHMSIFVHIKTHL